MPRSQFKLVCLASVIALASCSRAERPKKMPEPAVEPKPSATKLAPASVEQRAPRVPKDLSWLAFGGGSDPLSNQISIAQDLELASSLLAGRGMTLFASGPGALVAIERTDPLEGDASEAESALGLEIARILGPAGAERVRYEPAALAIDAPSTREHVVEVLRSALEVGVAAREQAAREQNDREPLLVVAAGHGEQGSEPRENELALWGGWALNVQDIAELLDRAEHPRPTRWVVMSCFGGGFAELAFVDADPSKGPRSPDHCGVFAAPWDDESSGCDPNPDRRKQESFAIHFLAALRGQGRSGEDRLAEIDLDRDARVGLAEAHAWARIHSRSFDVPTTTSERFLRQYARPYEPERGAAEPDREELSVVRALAAELELDDERAARSKLRELEQILADASAQLEDAQRGSDDAFYALRIALLERWPLLEHAWEPRARALVEREGARILQLLTDSELARGHAAATRELDEASAQYDAVRVARARTLRLVRAYETLRLAGALKRRGGARYAHYQALRRCERFAPEVRAPLRRAELVHQPRISAAVESNAHAK